MRALATIIVAWSVFMALVTHSAFATTGDTRIDAVASRFAEQPVTVACYAKDENGDPGLIGSWGYVYLWDTVENMAAEVCVGAIGLLDHDPTVPNWEKALGALVVTHESYHLRKWWRWRGDESRVECAAIRHVRYTMRFLGATAEEAAALMPYALSIHWQIAAVNHRYYFPACVVPSSTG